MIRQLQTLLDDSKRYYRGRQLKKALNAAQIALEFGINAGTEPPGLLRANLLLAEIYNTNGKYRSDPSYFTKALNSAKEAERLNKLDPEPSATAEILLAKGKIHLNKKETETASKCFCDAMAIADETGDTALKIYTLCAWSQLCMENGEYQKAVSTAESGLSLISKCGHRNHDLLKAAVCFQLSQAYIKTQDYSRSLEMSQQLLEASRKVGEAEMEVLALRNIAVVCGVKSNYKIGMQYFLEALDKCEAIGYRELLAQIQINIGTLYAHLYNYDEAIRRYRLVLEDHTDILDETTRIILFNNLGNIYFSIEQPDAALPHFENANAIATQEGLDEMIAYTLAQICRTKIKQQHFSDAEQFAADAQALFSQNEIANGKQIHFLNMGSLAFHNEQYPQAESFIRQAIELSQAFKDNTSEIRGYKMLASVYKAKGEFEQALLYQEQYAEIQEAYARLQRSRQFLDLEIRHAIREKQKEIEQLTTENEFQALLLQKRDQIARQNEELLRANEDLRQFAYVVSHDIKEPLRMIGSYTQLIRKLAEPLMEEKDREYFQYVTEGVERMNSLLDGLLKYTTIGNTKMENEDVDLNKIIGICLANLRSRIMETSAVVTIHELPTVSGNSQLFVQLFQNLLSNALKFTKPGIQPIVHVEATRCDQEYTIRIADNGIGISKKDQTRIFKIFQRLHRRSDYEGTGIGLAICQKIAARLGGSIQVESEIGQGAVFIVKLPVTAGDGAPLQ